MNDLGNKEIMSKNLKRYIELSGKERKEIAEALDVSYSTFTDWVNGKNYPRIDNIERLATYFKIAKSDLVEEYNPYKSLGSILTVDENDTELLDILRTVVEMTKEQREKLKPIVMLIKSNLL